MKSLVRKSVQALNAYVPGEQPGPGKYIKLNTNENPYPASPKVQEMLLNIAAEKLRLYPDPVCAELRAKIAELHGCSPAQVFVGNGSDEILALCANAFVENDGRIGYFDPSYSLYPVLADIRGVTKTPVPLRDDFGWPDDDAAAMRCLDGCSLFFLTNPNAPTGILYPKARVAEFCRRFQGVVLIDEAYVDFAEENCLDLALTMDNVVAARTLSKSYSLAGLRVGCAIGPEPLIQTLFKLKDSYNVGMPAQKLALAALSDIEHMRANARKIKATRARLSDALTKAGYTVCPSRANFVWARPSGIGAKDLFQRLRERGILIRHFSGPRTDEFVRISIGTDQEIDALLKAMADIANTTVSHVTIGM